MLLSHILQSCLQTNISFIWLYRSVHLMTSKPLKCWLCWAIYHFIKLVPQGWVPQISIFATIISRWLTISEQYLAAIDFMKTLGSTSASSYFCKNSLNLLLPPIFNNSNSGQFQRSRLMLLTCTCLPISLQFDAQVRHKKIACFVSAHCLDFLEQWKQKVFSSCSNILEKWSVISSLVRLLLLLDSCMD